jgi:hypothetical protein
MHFEPAHPTRLASWSIRKDWDRLISNTYVVESSLPRLGLLKLILGSLYWEKEAPYGLVHPTVHRPLPEPDVLWGSVHKSGRMRHVNSSLLFIPLVMLMSIDA